MPEKTPEPKTLSEPCRILFFYTANKRSIALETKLLELKKRGYEILVLTTCSKGDLHTYLEEHGLSTYAIETTGSGMAWYWQQVRALIKFCKKHRINLVFSHLQQANFIAVWAGFFMKTGVIVFRHHFRYTEPGEQNMSISRNEVRFDKFINRWAKKIVVPSSGVYNNILRTEKVKKEKLFIIPYIYDFSQYQQPDQHAVEQIKQQYPCKLRLIMVSRLIRLKRHHIVLPVIKKLVNEGYAIKMLVLDEGPEKQAIENYILENNLQDAVYLVGFRRDFVNYMAACDLLVQPSLTDASNSAAKEMALFGKTIAVSSGVGDYDDYVKDQVNGYLLPTENTHEALEKVIREAYQHPENLENLGKQLRNDVISRFNRSPEVVDLYIKLIHEHVV